MKLEIVADASGLPLGAAAAAANVSEYQLAMPALDDVSIQIPEGTPVIADRGHDSDELRDDIEDEGLEPIIPHRRGRVRPSRNDGRRLRRYHRRYVIERTNAWLHCYRGLAVRWAYYSFMYIGLVYTAFIAMALKRF
jgi:transposase